VLGAIALDRLLVERRKRSTIVSDCATRVYELSLKPENFSDLRSVSGLYLLAAPSTPPLFWTLLASGQIKMRKADG
jgi:hypothetical protein